MATERPRITVSANAFAGVGGQGINLSQMIAGLSESFDVAVFSRGSIPHVRSVTTTASRLGRLLGGVPVLRRFRDQTILLDDIAFDRQVARQLPECEIFQGVTGQCLSSLKKIKDRGGVTVLDSITAHIDEFATIGRMECDRFGVRFPIGRRMQSRMRKEYELADKIRVMSDYAQSTFTDRGFDSEKVVVAEPHYEMSDFAGVLPGKHPFRVCYLGALEPWKGFHYLLEAFTSLSLENAELKLWGGAGTRPVTDYLRHVLASSRTISQNTVDVRATGYKTVFGGASVLVHPSLSDGFGQVVAEAMACGIPVIVTNSTGASCLVEDGKNGFLVPPGDADAIADRLNFLAENRDKISTMGSAARETVARFSRARFQQRYVPYLLGLLSVSESV